MIVRTTRVALFSLAVLLAATGALAGVWTAATEPDIPPSDPMWEFTGDLYDREYVAGDYLRIDSMSEGALDYCHFQIIDDPSMDWTALNAVTARVRVGDVAEGKMGAASISVYGPNGDGSCDLYSLRFDAGRVLLRNVNTWEPITLDTSVWHDYTMVVDPGADEGAGRFYVFVDGDYLGQASARPNVPLDFNGVRWGDASQGDEAGVSDWNFVKWGADTTIPELPEPPLTLADGDLNGDNFVGSADLDIVRANWGTSVGGTISYLGTWTGDALPQDSTPAWVPRGDMANATIVTDGPDAPYMNLDTPATFGNKTDPGAYCDFDLTNTTAIDLTEPVVVDFRMRINGRSDPPDSSPQVNAINFYHPDGNGNTKYYVLWAMVDSFAGAAVDTSEWHDYRVSIDPAALVATVYVDDFSTPAATITPGTINNFDLNGIRFGDLSDSRAGDADWAFIGWTDDAGSHVLQGDANGDGVVNSGDLDIVRANWGRGTPPAAAIPEPMTFGLIVFAAALVLVKRKKR